MPDAAFYNPFFKVLTQSDSGEGTDHISGILIPRDSRPYFPAIRGSGPNVAVHVRAELVLADGTISSSILSFSRVRRGETRLTSGFDALRKMSVKDDIVLVERSRASPPVYRMRILKQGTREYEQVLRLAGGRRWGMLNGWNYTEKAAVAGGSHAPARPRYRESELREERVLVARVERVEGAGNSRRISFELDGIDADIDEQEYLRALHDDEIIRPFALSRIVATRRQLAALFGTELPEGTWIELTVGPSREFAPLAYVAQLTQQGYTDEARGSVRRIRILAEPGEPPREFGPAGASVARRRQQAQAIIKRSRLPRTALAGGKEIAAILAPLLGDAFNVRVRDVGQASFVTLQSPTGRELLHFDAGWPISYNRKTAPSRYPAVDSAPVVLSHWDWDHLHAYYGVASLRESCWIVPDQSVGPGAFRVASLLHDRGLLKIYAGANLPAGGGALIRCSGTSGLNDSGLALSVALISGRTALLVGDASYVSAGAAGATTYDMLVATHHGAAFEGPVPRPAFNNAPCIVSVGLNNVYGHPSKAALKAHRRQHWEIRRTCQHRKVGRGDRVIP